MPKKVKAAPQSTIYYVGRVLQRISLLLAGTGTVILWISMISISQNTNLLYFTNLYDRIIDSSAVNTMLTSEIDSLAITAAILSLVAIVISLLLLKLPRVRKHEKRLVVDGVVVASFFLFFSLYGESIYRFIINHIIL